MLFRRRKPAGFKEKMRELLWPRKGFLRPIRYLTMRILRLSASPHAVAAGVAAGVFVSWTPFIGVHFIMAFVITYFLSGNMVAAALGCAAFGNPLTYPFIWGITWEIGHLLLSREDHLAGQAVDLAAMFHKLNFMELWKPVLEPMLLGAIPPGIVTAVALYALTFYTVRGFQTRRRTRLMERARLRLADPASDIPSV
ncbi:MULTISPECIES: DUF2062 domain-containing protein [Rhizobium]|jgi:uncharacterized protein (DUF2062 family)|uniref:DUF2062 domain-containing protein n=4 Tax=Rhizobium TaxID=379 RepID=A0ABY0B0A1_9HYPH|nr:MULTISPECIES: DUF2062 domain-containing protein [Rhizobium]RSB71995.1 DUF2062 domain-containing protein [Rhizobium pisi]RUM06627.1 DUF2062 domain-containing protein [Rhizobium fabae]TCA58868.1 DUF2062 domain-containing protein [Rhizobium pisi]